MDASHPGIILQSIAGIRRQSWSYRQNVQNNFIQNVFFLVWLGISAYIKRPY